MATKKNNSRRITKNEPNPLIELGLQALGTAIVAGVSTLWDKWAESGSHKQTPNVSSKQKGNDNSNYNSIKWWQVLGVKMYATEDEIEQAFRIKIAKVHPDKVAHLSEKLQKVAEEEARLLIEARRQGLANSGM